MAQSWNTCRFCKKQQFETPYDRMVQYAPRHWAHPECAIERLGADEFFGRLMAVQINSLPWKLVETHQDAIRAQHPEVKFAWDGAK